MEFYTGTNSFIESKWGLLLRHGDAASHVPSTELAYRMSKEKERLSKTLALYLMENCSRNSLKYNVIEKFDVSFDLVNRTH